jgi:HEAT repeat protein
MAKRSLLILPILLSGLVQIASCKTAESKPTQPQNINQTATAKSPIVEPSIAVAQSPVVTKPLRPEQTAKVNALTKKVMACGGDDVSAVSDELYELGDAAIPIITQVLRNPSEAVRNCGCAYLILFNQRRPLKSALQSTILLLKDPDAKVRENAVYSVQWVNDLAKPAIPFLIPLLKDADTKVRVRTVKMLSYQGILVGFAESDITSLRPAIPSLILLLKDSNAEIRENTVQVLGAMGGSAKSAVPSLTPLLKDPNADVRYHTARAIEKVGESAKLAK